MKKLINIIVLTIISTICYSQSVDIKDGDSNSLITINDEGSAGSITIPDASSVGTTTNKLYNEGSALKWNGSTLSTGSSLWTLSSGNVYRSSGNVGIGTINPTFKLDIYSTGTGILKLNANNPQMDFYNNSSAHTYIQAHSDNFYIINRLATGTIYMGTNNTTDLAIDTDGEVGIGTTAPDASLDVSGDVILGVTGTRFIEIQEITGITGTGTSTPYTDKLPVGWTGAKTRVLSFELQRHNNSGAWYSTGFQHSFGADEISYNIVHINRDVTIYYDNDPTFHSRTWRMMIMRMP